MKKKLFLALIFTLFLSISLIDFTAVKADATSINISVDGSYSTYFNQEELVFNADYSLFNNYSALTFTANSNSDEQVTFSWGTKDGTTISNSSTLKLYKSINSESIANITNDNLNSNLILVGTTTYKLTATYANSTKITKSVTVVITQTNEKYNISTYCSKSSQSEITKISESFNVYAFLPTTKAHSINWYLKTPNEVSYNLVSPNSNTYTLSPSELITDQNGYGAYKLYAIATEKSTSGNTYSSKIFEFVAIPSAPTTDANSYQVVSKEVNNSKTKIQAFEYSIIEKGEGIASASVLDSNRILWYVNGVLTSRGRTFKYEPTSTDVYNITVKYLNTNNSVIQIASYREQPSSTGIGILLLIIVIAVVILSGIFTLSVVIINKKRDVVW